jgi:hypothetical protein
MGRNRALDTLTPNTIIGMQENKLGPFTLMGHFEGHSAVKAAMAPTAKYRKACSAVLGCKLRKF